MRRLIVLGAIFVGLLVAFGLAGKDGFQTARPAEAVATTTTWMFPSSGGISVGSGPSTATTLSVPAPCTNCYITRIVPDLVYESDPNHLDGTTANFNGNGDNVWLHHMVILDQCKAGFPQIFASGNERTTWSLPAGYGYFQAACGGAPNVWAVNYHIHNSGSFIPSSVALKLVVTYQPQADNLTPVTGVWLDMSSLANNSEYTVPTGYSDTHTGSGATGISNDWTSTIQGQIVAIGGHVHDYGISASAYNNRLGDYICTSTAGYGAGSRYWPAGGPGTPGHPAAGNQVTLNQAYWEANGSPDDRYHIQAMTSCTPTPAQSIICKNDVVRLHTQYNNGSGFPIFDAMGIITADVATNLPDANGNGTIDACDNSSDTDSDSLGQTATSTSGPCSTGGTAQPKFRDCIEAFIGTNPSVACGGTALADGTSSSWPVDFNNDKLVNVTDRTKMALQLKAYTANNVTGYNKRYDLNADGAINTVDRTIVALYIKLTGSVAQC